MKSCLVISYENYYRLKISIRKFREDTFQHFRCSSAFNRKFKRTKDNWKLKIIDTLFVVIYCLTRLKATWKKIKTHMTCFVTNTIVVTFSVTYALSVTLKASFYKMHVRLWASNLMIWFAPGFGISIGYRKFFWDFDDWYRVFYTIAPSINFGYRVFDTLSLRNRVSVSPIRSKVSVDIRYTDSIPEDCFWSIFSSEQMSKAYWSNKDSKS